MRLIHVMLKKTRGGTEQAFIDYCRLSLIGRHATFAVVHKKCLYKNDLRRHGIAFKEIGSSRFWARFWIKKQIMSLAPDAVFLHDSKALRLGTLGHILTIAVCHHTRLIKNHLKRISVIFALTSSMRDIIKRAHPQATIYIFPNTFFGKDKTQKSFRTIPTIGTMGRLSSNKGFDVFLKALALLKDESIEFRALIAGDGKKKKELHMLAKKLNLTDQITFCGWISDKKLFYTSIDIFCLPSTLEPFGLVLLEAMYHEKPIIATKTHGPLDIIENKKTGLLVPPNDFVSLAQALKSFIKNMEKAHLMGKEGNARFYKDYTPTAASIRLNQILLQIKK